MSDYIRKEACPHCGSSDANALYDDGHHYCFSCETYTLPEGGKVEQQDETFVTGVASALPKRNISLDTCRFWDYRVGSFNGQTVQIANYKDDTGKTIGQKLRFANKDFVYLGSKDAGLYGKHLWRSKGKMVVVVEGEIDALSISEHCFKNKWPVVSLPHGAASAKKSISKSLEWLEQFESVVFCFDQDEQGQKAAQESALLLSPGKAKIVTLPMKDANEMVKAKKGAQLLDCIWGAKDFRPDGIIQGDQLWELVSTKPENESVSYPYDGLNQKTLGLRRGEIVTVTAGSGIGKSQFCKEIAHHLIGQGETIGYIALEENVRRTALGLMSLSINKPIHLGDDNVTEKELKHAFDSTLGTSRVFLYDHWGSTDSDNLLNKIRFLARGCGCSFLVLDHISIVVSGFTGSDERRLIDNTLTSLRTLVEELQIGLVLVSHLKRPEGNKGHEEGQITSMSQLRGSAAIGQLSDMVIGLERNQQSEDNPNITTARVLKNRFSGETGIACSLEYSKHTGRMTETVFQNEDINDIPF